MCGLAGILVLPGDTSAGSLGETAASMAHALYHRGPDSAGVWVDQNAHIALGHQRLAVIDLSPAGHQPMTSPDGRYVIAYNGEVYNFADLRTELEGRGRRFRGHSDTEVVLGAISEWGLLPALERFIGMFAFALWDGAERRLHLVRDRLGIKPLYYGRIRRRFVFASELRAIRHHPDFDADIDRDALALYLRFNNVPAPWSIFRGIRKLMPGTVLSVDGKSGDETVTSFWSLRDIAEKGVAAPFAGDEDEAEERLEGLLRDAVKDRMVADVPLGVLLSGGIDSNAVAALMQAANSTPVSSFTVAFPGSRYDEGEDARAVARHLGMHHSELAVTAADVLAAVPELPAMVDEPFADSSQIPSLLISRHARREVTVCLSGDGGDEVFGGYNRYAWCEPAYDRLRLVPRAVRKVVGHAMTAVAPTTWDHLFQGLAPLLPRSWRLHDAGDKVHKAAGVIAAPDLASIYRRLVSQWQQPESVVVNCRALSTLIDRPEEWASLPDFTRQMAYLDTMTYLPDDILAKVDRASMAASLEVRVPLLDHRVVEFAWSLPMSMKVGGGLTKRILRRVLYRFVPRELIDRAKWGFSVPIHEWLRGPLHDWADALLAEKQLRDDGLFDPGAVRAAWQQHLSGRRNLQHELWSILMFQAWLRAA